MNPDFTIRGMTMGYLHIDGSAAPTLAALALAAVVFMAMRLDSAALHRRLKAESEARRLWNRGVTDASLDGLLVHRQGVILMMNRALVRMLGVREREWVGQSFATLAQDDHVAPLRAELEAPQPALAEFTLLRADKTPLIVEVSSQTVEFEGLPATATAIRDITQRRADAEKIVRLTHYDALTGLPNRELFTGTLQAALAGTTRGQAGVTLLLMDIDNFKLQNQQLGRAGADMLLQMLALRMVSLLTTEDMLARLGGDKFALLLAASGPPNRGVSLGGQLLAACGEPFIVEGRLARLTLSAGLAMYPEHAADAEALMRVAALALGKARESGGGLYVYRHEDNTPQRITGLAPEALRGEPRVLYQPVFNLSDLSLAGFEALPRWQHPARGLLGPEEFMPLAESAGMAQELCGQMIERACAEALAANVPRISLNLLELSTNLPARIAAILRKTGLKPEALEIEVSEAQMANRPEQGQLLRELQSIGVGIALDDFGTGATTLNALRHLPLTRLKIDRRYTAKLGLDRNADAMLGATLTLAASLRLEVTALGVETEAQLALLREAGCHAAQGRLLGEPASRPVARPASRHEAAMG
ncbi:MAG: EAL domain-containing protein [Acidocella sp.]|nr:EAL domain-containing protein [Acidocella sp.]